MARMLRDPVQDLIEGLVELLDGLPFVWQHRLDVGGVSHR